MAPAFMQDLNYVPASLLTPLPVTDHTLISTFSQSPSSDAWHLSWMTADFLLALKHSSAHFCLKCLCPQFEGESVHSIWVEVLGAGPHVSSSSFLWLQNKYQPEAGSHLCSSPHHFCMVTVLLFSCCEGIMTKASYFVFETRSLM